MLFRERKANRQRIAEIKGWAAELLPVSSDVTWMVSELECREAGCPPVETVIAALAAGQAPRQWKLHKPIVDVTRDDVAALPERDAHGRPPGWRCPD